MQSSITSNEGTCFVCHQTILAEQAIAHLKVCGSVVKVHQVEHVFQIIVASGNDYWVCIEAAGSTTLQDLYLFLRNNWWECCGHVSEFIVDGADTTEPYMDKTLTEMFVVGSTFYYDHNSEDPDRVTGHVLALKKTKPIKSISLILRKNMHVEKCESCLEQSH